MKKIVVLCKAGMLLCTINYAQQLIASPGSEVYKVYTENPFQQFCDTISVTDIDGNIYKTVRIGNQTWMAENLKTTKYNDGFAIPLATEADNLYYSSFAPAYCWYKYDETYKSPYGALYNWPTVNTGKLCPITWHVPTDTEWSTLNDYLGGDKFAGDKMKETGHAHWAILNDSATNESGFTAVPTEVRWGDGSFNSMGHTCTWWSSTEYNGRLAISRGLWYYNSSGIFRQIDHKANCSSIRCIKDNNDSIVHIDLEKGLLAYFPFYGNAIDESGNGNNGIVNGATLTTDRFRSPNKAYLFNGQGNYITINGFNLAPSSTTIACWVKATNGSVSENIISKHNAGNAEILVKIVNYKYQIEWTIGNAYFTLNDEFGQFSVNPNNPRFDLLVLIYDEQREQVRFYVNNILIASHNISGRIVKNDFPMTFGKDSNHNSEYFNGIIDDIRIYNRPLNIEEIQTLFNDRDITFTTPVLKTQTVRLITQNSATSGGAISSDGGTEITSKGVCWSRYPNPDTTSNKTNNGTGIENYKSILTGLTPNTTYYIRAYAINGAGIKFGNEFCFRTMDTTKYGIISDIEGNIYKTVQIGAQKWMAENLKTSKLNDGTMIPWIKENALWSKIGNVAYSWYNNDSITFKNTFGALYNGYAVNTEKLCPVGWHVPNDAEWDTLSAFLGGNIVAGGKMKEVGNTHWANPNTGANNESEFSALPGGIRYSGNGNYADIYYAVYWWSTQVEGSEGLLYSRHINYNNCILYPSDDKIKSGHSVRCREDLGDPNRAKPELKTQSVSFITQNSATSGGAISYDGGSPITAKGICWSASPYPTYNKTMDGSGVDSFISSITGLTPSTTYYVRAYAINYTGVGYGDELSFTTLPEIIYGSVTDVEGNIYKTVQIGPNNWMAENLKVTKFNDGSPILNVTDNHEWGSLTNGAYCWYNNDEETYKKDYGALYNYPVIMDERNICPTGWHISKGSEWATLPCTHTDPYPDEFGHYHLCIDLAAVGYWGNKNTNATGFTAIPSGLRQGLTFEKQPSGRYAGSKLCAFYWKPNGEDIYLSSDYGLSLAHDLHIFSSLFDGYSIRCVEDRPIISFPDLSIVRNETFEIPIYADNLPEGDVISYQFEFFFNSNKLVYMDNSLDGTISSDGGIQINPLEGKLSLAWAGQMALADSGILIKLRFKATAFDTLAPFISNFLVNTDTVKYITNGKIIVSPDYGDVDDNSYVQAYDAAVTLQYSVGLDPLPAIDPLPWDAWRTTCADVDGLTGISAYDASLILQYTVGLIDFFPVKGYKKSASELQADVTVSTEDGFIVFRSKGDLYGLNVTIEGNPETLGIPWISDQKMLQATNIASSSYSVGLATANVPSENEAILKIPIIKTPVQPVTLNLIINNKVKLIDLGLPTGISDPLSKSIEIYPNPANTILYFKNLPKNVSISIFDLQGREIITRTITNNQVDISILDHGLYTIHIENGENTIIRKLIKD